MRHKRKNPGSRHRGNADCWWDLSYKHGVLWVQLAKAAAVCSPCMLQWFESRPLWGRKPNLRCRGCFFWLPAALRQFAWSPFPCLVPQGKGHWVPTGRSESLLMVQLKVWAVKTPTARLGSWGRAVCTGMWAILCAREGQKLQLCAAFGN